MCLSYSGLKLLKNLKRLHSKSCLTLCVRNQIVEVSSLLLGSLEHVLDAQGQLDVVLSMARTIQA